MHQYWGNGVKFHCPLHLMLLWQTQPSLLEIRDAVRSPIVKPLRSWLVLGPGYAQRIPAVVCSFGPCYLFLSLCIVLIA